MPTATPRSVWPGVTRATATALLFASTVSAEAQQTTPPAVSVARMLGANDHLDAATREQGEALYRDACAACHDTGANRGPHVGTLAFVAPEAVLRAVTSGPMKAQAAALSPDQRRVVAPPLRCNGTAARFDRAEQPAFAGWGLDAGGGYAIPADVAEIDRSNLAKLHLKWAIGFRGALSARSQPALAADAIFVGSGDGTVFALDRETGCARWTFHAAAEVCTGIVVSPWKAAERALVFFGDLVGHAYAVDAFTGNLVWQKTIDGHPSATSTGTPALYRSTLYVPVSSYEEVPGSGAQYACCTFRGSLVALDSRTGAERWRRHTIDAPATLRGKNSAGTDRFGPSGAPIWSSPLVDAARGQIYVTTGDNYSSPSSGLSDAVIAIDLRSGAIRWTRQVLARDSFTLACNGGEPAACPDEKGPDFDFGAAAALTRGTDGKDILLAGQKSGIAYGIDPDSGAIRWSQKIGRGGAPGGIHFGIASGHGRAYLPVTDYNDGVTYPEPAKPGIYALDPATGAYLWRAPAENGCADKLRCSPGYSAAVSVTPDLVLAGSTVGHLRAYDAASGKLLRDMDTDQAYTTVNGTTAHGGAISGGGAPIAWHGKLIVNSGYGLFRSMPGNVMLVYDVN